jgi:hypothetical protein
MRLRHRPTHRQLHGRNTDMAVGTGVQGVTTEVPAGAPRITGDLHLHRRHGVTRAITGAGVAGGGADGHGTEAMTVADAPLKKHC